MPIKKNKMISKYRILPKQFGDYFGKKVFAAALDPKKAIFVPCIKLLKCDAFAIFLTKLLHD